jgi:peptidoglycan/xylan/chitin deacetylase (PgdA/CDA1 family)
VVSVRIRIDDVMWDSSEYPSREKAIRQFTKIHRWTTQTSLVTHIPTILVEDIQKYPEVITLVEQETKEGRMSPELHGYHHIDYCSQPEDVIEEHLEKSFKWFRETLDIEPTIWCTPWGGTNKKIEDIAKKHHLTVETTHNTVSPGIAVKVMKRNPAGMFGHTIMDHWWKRGLQLLRVVDILKYGSYEEAKEWDKANRGKNSIW